MCSKQAKRSVSSCAGIVPSSPSAWSSVANAAARARAAGRARRSRASSRAGARRGRSRMCRPRRAAPRAKARSRRRCASALAVDVGADAGGPRADHGEERVEPTRAADIAELTQSMHVEARKGFRFHGGKRGGWHTHPIRNVYARRRRSSLLLAGRAERGEASREEIDAVLAEIVGAQRQLFGPHPRAARGEGGRQRILAYLLDHVGRTWQARSLRQQVGSTNGRDACASSASSMVTTSARSATACTAWRVRRPDVERARRWTAANTIRRFEGRRTRPDSIVPAGL